MIDVTASPYNAACDGTDASVALQAALRDPDPDVRFPSGMSFCARKLMVPSGKRLHMTGARLYSQDVVLNQWLLATELGARDIKIIGGMLEGDARTVPTTTFSVLLRLDDAEDVVIDGLTGRFAKTEVLSITGNRGCRKIYIRDSSFLGCRRSGASVVHGDDIEFVGCKFDGNTGNPGAGCDVESNANQDSKNVRFMRCTFNDNTKGLYAHPGLGLPGANYSVIGCEALRNATHGAILNSIQGLLVSGSTFAGSPLGVSIGSATEARRASGVNFERNVIQLCSRGLVLAGVRDSYFLDNAHCGVIETPVLGTSADVIFLGNRRVA